MLFVLAVLLAAPPGADDHLIAGARAFRGGEFARALVEFRVAEKLAGPGEASWYAAAALVKLGHPEDALIAFAQAEQTAPTARDALLDYYRALACYDARLYLCAARLFAEVGDQGGPRIAEMAKKTRESIDKLFATPPAKGAVDWYREKASIAHAAKREALARLYDDEAVALAARMAK